MLRTSSHVSGWRGSAVFDRFKDVDMTIARFQPLPATFEKTSVLNLDSEAGLADIFTVADQCLASKLGAHRSHFHAGIVSPTSRASPVPQSGYLRIAVCQTGCHREQARLP